MASSKSVRGFRLWISCALLLVLCIIFHEHLATCYTRLTHIFRKRMNEKSYSVQDRIETYGPQVEPRWQERFAKAPLSYPPKKMTLLAIKDSRLLEVYVPDSRGKMTHVHTYMMTAFSGALGPKLREGDGQIPEGIYPIDSLNPNSSYHLSLRVGYPNSFDRKHARADGRTSLGGDIMIHGKDVTIGCIPLGDEAIEELFVLSAKIGVKNITLVSCPTDFRLNSTPLDTKNQPSWYPELCELLRKELERYPAPIK